MSHIDKAKTMIFLPFPIVADKRIETIGSIGGKDEILYSSDFMDTLTLQQTIEHLEHETKHIILQRKMRGL
jgi:hypothetical protein